MEKIEGVELTDIVSTASEELLSEQKRNGVNKVKKLFAAIYDLTNELAQIERTKTKKTEQLAKKNAILEKVKAGDWSALVDDQQGKQDGKSDMAEKSDSNY